MEALFARQDDKGGIAPLVTSAAIGKAAPILDFDPEDWTRSLDVNLTAIFRLMKAQIPLLMQAGGGAIINNSSTGGLQGVRTMADYCAAKWGLIGLTKTAALEYAEHGIRVNVIAPGIIQTEKMLELQRTNPDLFDQLRTQIPSKRFGDMQDIAETVTWLMSDHSAYVNGVVLPVDGGRTAGCAASDPSADARLVQVLRRPGLRPHSGKPELFCDASHHRSYIIRDCVFGAGARRCAVTGWMP